MNIAPSSITGLRHIGLAVENFEECLEYYTQIWGLEIAAQEEGLAFLASPLDPAAFILRLRRSDVKRLDLISLAASCRADVDALAERLSIAGVPIDRQPATLATPGGGYGMRFFDAEGRLVEVSSDVAERVPSESNVRGVPLNLSHVVLNALDLTASREFYQEHLGLKISDWLEDRMCFLRCASRKHHIMAISMGPHVALNHVAYDVGTIDGQMRATGRLKAADQKMIWGPGRHFIGNNSFSYFIDPAGNVCEFTAELEEVDDATWEPRRVGMAPQFQDQWGTGGLVTDGMIPAQFNTPDQGLWTSSPV